MCVTVCLFVASKTGLKGRVHVVMSAEEQIMRERAEEVKLVGGQLMRGESAEPDRLGGGAH